MVTMSVVLTVMRGMSHGMVTRTRQEKVARRAVARAIARVVQ